MTAVMTIMRDLDDDDAGCDDHAIIRPGRRLYDGDDYDDDDATTTNFGRSGPRLLYDVDVSRRRRLHDVYTIMRLYDLDDWCTTVIRRFSRRFYDLDILVLLVIVNGGLWSFRGGFYEIRLISVGYTPLGTTPFTTHTFVFRHPFSHILAPPLNMAPGQSRKPLHADSNDSSPSSNRGRRRL